MAMRSGSMKPRASRWSVAASTSAVGSSPQAPWMRRANSLVHDDEPWKLTAATT